MCGFTAFYNLKILEDKNKFLFNCIENRGPDKNTYLKVKNINLFFSRLKIQDLTDNGDQPIYSKSKKYLLMFNGEIYNHFFIREEINKHHNINWLGTSDSETLVESFDLLGIDETLDLIKGMFSIFLFDVQRNIIYLINDIFGEKPLYYEVSDDSFFISSSIKSFSIKKNELNPSSIKELVTRNYINHPNTIWKNVKKIKPANIFSFNISDIKNISQKTYYNKSKKFNLINNSNDEILNIFEKKLFSAVEHQMISDVPLGSFLSGGIDSSLITCIASKISDKPLNTFSMGFNEAKFDEAIYAKEIASYLKTNHHEKYLTKDDVVQNFDDILNAYEEPFSDSSQIPTYLLCKHTAKKVSVVLTGDGGDELFGGYYRYNFNPKIWKMIRFLPANIRRLISTFLVKNKNFSLPLAIYLLTMFNPSLKKVNYFDHKLLQLFRAINSNNLLELTTKLSSHIEENTCDKYLFKQKLHINLNLDNYANNEIESLMMYDTLNYLPGDLLVKVDRASMDFGLEARTPFLDRDVFEFSKQIPLKYKISKNSSKIILKKLLKRFLPTNLFERPKQGFLLPINLILTNDEISDKIDKILDKDKINNQKVFDYNYVSNLRKKFKQGDYFDQYLLWDIIVAQNWLNKYYLK